MSQEMYLTDRQMEVLRLRSQGRKQQEIAEILGTTRENVSIMEKRARENLEKARRTLDAYAGLDPVVMRVEKGTDIFLLPDQVMRTADRHGISMVQDKTSVIVQVRRQAGRRIQGNRVSEGFELAILRTGKVRV